MSNFIEDIATLIGLEIHDNKLSTNQIYKRHHRTFDRHIDKNIDNIEQKLLTTVDESGTTVAKVMYDKNDPDWFYYENNLPKDVVKRIKQKSNIP